MKGWVNNVKKNKFEIDMCNGSIMDKLISFSLPLMVSGILQLAFNAVDIIVVGRFSGSQALAAVGSTTALINVFTNLFIGISLGANVLAARFYAAGKDREMSETVHTSITLALISGIMMAVIGVLLAKWALEIMYTLLRFAFNNCGLNELDDQLNGTTSLAICADDPVAPARVIADYAKKLKDKFEIKGGFMDGKVVSMETVNALASIPALPVLQAQVLGTMLAPISALACVLKQIAEKDGAAAE